MVALVALHYLQGLVDAHARRLELREGSRGVQVFGEGLLFPDNKVEVDQLVREAGELVAEAEVVLSCHVCLEVDGVVGPALGAVQLRLLRTVQRHIDIIVPARYNLHTCTCTYRAYDNH